MHQFSSKTGKWFLILHNFGWMVDLAMSIFEFHTKFLIFWHHWDLWICIRSVCWKWNLKQIEAIPPSVYSRLWNKRSPWNEFHIMILLLFYINLDIVVIFYFYFLQNFSKIDKRSPMSIPESRVVTVQRMIIQILLFCDY